MPTSSSKSIARHRTGSSRRDGHASGRDDRQQGWHVEAPADPRDDATSAGDAEHVVGPPTTGSIPLVPADERWALAAARTALNASVYAQVSAALERWLESSPCVDLLSGGQEDALRASLAREDGSPAYVENAQELRRLLIDELRWEYGSAAEGLFDEGSAHKLWRAWQGDSPGREDEEHAPVLISDPEVAERWQEHLDRISQALVESGSIC